MPVGSSIRVLGIDPGFCVSGFGVIEQYGNRIVYVASGCIRTGEGAVAPRLKILFDSFTVLLKQYQPTVAAIEQVFVNVNGQTTLKLGQARGAILCALALADLPIAEYTALQVKKSVVGKGHASKHQVQEMVMRLLTLTARPQPDAADALATALCHAWMPAAGVLPGSQLRSGRLR